MTNFWDDAEEHEAAVAQIAKELKKLLTRWRDDASAFEMVKVSGHVVRWPRDEALEAMARDAAVAALMIKAESKGDAPQRVTQFILEKARRLSNIRDADERIAEWTKVSTAYDEPVATQLTRATHEASWRLDRPLDKPSPNSSFADDLRAALRAVAAGETAVTMTPEVADRCRITGAVPWKPRRGAPEDVQAANIAALAISLYVKTTGRSQLKKLAKEAPRKQSLQAFTHDLCEMLDLSTPGYDTMVRACRQPPAL